jgi:hypothetical protein
VAILVFDRSFRFEPLLMAREGWFLKGYLLVSRVFAGLMERRTGVRRSMGSTLSEYTQSELCRRLAACPCRSRVLVRRTQAPGDDSRTVAWLLAQKW